MKKNSEFAAKKEDEKESESLLSPREDKQTESILEKLPMETVAIYRCVGENAQTADQIMTASGFPFSDVIAALIKLEMYKLVISLPGARYKRPDKK